MPSRTTSFHCAVIAHSFFEHIERQFGRECSHHLKPTYGYSVLRISSLYSIRLFRRPNNGTILIDQGFLEDGPAFSDAGICPRGGNGQFHPSGDHALHAQGDG